MKYQGKLYRALNPIYAGKPLSGRGAELFGGRFNARGLPALYLASSPVTALREANQAGTLQPTMLVGYDANIGNVYDTRDAKALQEAGISAGDLADPSWRVQMRANGHSRTQSFAQKLIDQGYHGLLVRSFANGSSPEDLNLVLWVWGENPPAQLIVNDDEGRLSGGDPRG